MRMIWKPSYRVIFILLASLLVLVGGLQAQEDNLLENPGFEEPFIDRGGDPARQVAQGWNPWHVSASANAPSWQNQQPEYQPVAPNTLRIRNGENAQLYFSYFATHTGGVFQRVTGIEPGTELRFSVYAYVWSSTFSEQDESELPGGVILQVGIDPTGGTDSTSSNIVWSTPAEQYDAYRQYAVIAEATSNAVTVFVRSSVEEPVENNYIYLDDAVLAETTDSGQPGNGEEPTDTPEPVNTDTPEPTETSELTDTPEPVNTDTPEPTETPDTNGGGEDPTPTAEDELPTDTPMPTNTPLPTNTPEPTNTPADDEPTDIPEPTNTPMPTATSVPISDQFPYSIVHTVVRGDTLFELARLYGSDVNAIRQANDLGLTNLIFEGQRLVVPVAVPPNVTEPEPTATTDGSQDNGIIDTSETGVSQYVVQPGDTLFSIARRFNTTVGALANLNGIVNVNRILVGQTIRVPGPTGGAATPTPVPPDEEPQTYVVQYGDNLFRVALRFGVNPQVLAEVNNITNPNLIFWGQTLVIP